MRIIIVLILVLGIASCCPNKLTVADKQKWQAEIYGEEPFLKNQIKPIPIRASVFFESIGYIFPKQKKPSIEGRFTPSQQEILIAEKLLKERIKSLNVNANLKKRSRQYAGAIDKNGKKTIYINLVKLYNKCQEKSLNGFLLDKYFIESNDDDSILFYGIDIN